MLAAKVDQGRRQGMKEEENVERESHACLWDRLSDLVQHPPRRTTEGQVALATITKTLSVSHPSRQRTWR